MGIGAFVDQLLMISNSLVLLSEAERALYLSTPVWANVAFGFAVVGAALACLALLFKKVIAFYLFLLSLSAVFVQMFHAFFISDSFAVFGPGGLIMPIMIIMIAIALVIYSYRAKSKQWLN